MNPRPIISQIPQTDNGQKAKKPSGPNDFIGHSLVNPITNNIFKNPFLTKSGESVDKESSTDKKIAGLRENTILKKIVDNYNPEQGWNFLDKEKIALVNSAIDEYKKSPENLRVKLFLFAMVKQIQLPANAYFLEFKDVKNYYDKIIDLQRQAA